MTEAEWLAATDPQPMLYFLLGEGVEVDEASLADGELAAHRYPEARVSDRRLRLLAAACCRGIWDLVRDGRSRRAVEVAEAFADGAASWAELRAARDAADMELSARSLGLRANAYYAAEAAAWDEAGDAAAEVLRACATAGFDHSFKFWTYPRRRAEARQARLGLIRCIFGNPFRPAGFDPAWRTEPVVALCRGMYESRDFAAMPVLADALEDADCSDPDILAHCRGDGPHVRGCWVVDLVLGKG